MKIRPITISALLLSILVAILGCDLKNESNDYIKIVDSALKTDANGLKYIELKILFKKRAIGKVYADKPVNLLMQQFRYGKLPEKDKVFYFDSDYHFKIFVDLYGDDKRLIRTDSAYYNEYIPFHSKKEEIEILPGEEKNLFYGVPENVMSYKAWVTKD